MQLKGVVFLNTKVKEDMDRSIKAFERIVWPELSARLPGKIIRVEGNAGRMFESLDQLSGIDMWLVSDNGMRGISSRVQVCPDRRAYNTFTVRKARDSGAKTEFQKILDAISSDDNRVYPSLAIQAYVSAWENGKFLSCGVAKTSKIIQYILNGYAKVNRTTNAEFYIVPFADVSFIRVQDY